MNEPTRLLNTLDLLFTNDPLSVLDFEIDMPFGSSDHNSLRFNVFFNQASSAAEDFSSSLFSETYYAWDKANWPLFAQYCTNVRWNDLFSCCNSANECWNGFSNILLEGCKLFVPQKIKSKNKPLRKSKVSRQLTSKKRTLWKKNES